MNERIKSWIREAVLAAQVNTHAAGEDLIQQIDKNYLILPRTQYVWFSDEIAEYDENTRHGAWIGNVYFATIRKTVWYTGPWFGAKTRHESYTATVLAKEVDGSKPGDDPAFHTYGNTKKEFNTKEEAQEYVKSFSKEFFIAWTAVSRAMLVRQDNEDPEQATVDALKGE